MGKLEDLTAKLVAMAQEYKQIKLSIAAKNPSNADAKVAFTKEEAQEINAKVNKFEGIKDKAALDEAGKILAEELKTLIPAFLAKYTKVAEGQQKQLVGVKAKAEDMLKKIDSDSTVSLNFIQKQLNQLFYLYDADDNTSYKGKFFTFECLSPDNIIVIDKSGNVVWDDGSHDGALYLLTSNMDKNILTKKSAAEIVADKKNFKQLSQMVEIDLPNGTTVCVGEWIASDGDLKKYLKAQAKLAGFSAKVNLKVRKMTDDADPKNDTKNGMSLKWGDHNGNVLPENKRTLYLNEADVTDIDSNPEPYQIYMKNILLNNATQNPYDLQNILVHEEKHNQQANNMQKTGQTMSEAEMEIEAIETQMAHSSWANTSELHKKGTLHYYSQFKKM